MLSNEDHFIELVHYLLVSRGHFFRLHNPVMTEVLVSGMCDIFLFILNWLQNYLEVQIYWMDNALFLRIVFPDALCTALLFINTRAEC